MFEFVSFYFKQKFTGNTMCLFANKIIGRNKRHLGDCRWNRFSSHLFGFGVDLGWIWSGLGMDLSGFEMGFKCIWGEKIIVST